VSLDPNRVKTLFFAALDLPPDERAAFLARECGADAALRARLDELLAAHDESATDGAPPADGTRSFADAAATRDPDATRDRPGPTGEAGAVVGGKYTLVEPIGEGGMGSVWRARQTEPVKRFVALKLIKAGMDSRQVLARFEAERQALAVMDHPNIAKVLDGVLHDGRPYFVMELVKGVPITQYCDHHKLTPQARLELFVQACQAIQHAHQKGVIHRDVKPSNVLVALYDDRPVVKVIDFGVAKATGGTLTEATLDTGFGGVVGTPAYLSPEQATFNNLDVDTRSDVYTLGVLLYELLTGSPPFSGEELQRKGLLEMLRVVREEEPPRPSTKLSTADALPSLSANRGTEPKKLTGLLRNELDWIVMKTQEKDRTRRYETANGFAADVLRFLGGEPVHAHPPSAAYRLKKFVRRHRPQVIAVSLVLFALLAGVVGTTLGLLEAKKQEAEAKELARVEEARQRGVAEAETMRADKERQVAQAVNDFLQNKLLAQADTTAQADALLRAGGLSAEAKLNPTIRELLDRAAKELAPDRIEANFPNQPLVQAQILATVGNTYRGVGEVPTAIDFLKRSEALYRQHLGPDHPDALASKLNLAYALLVDGKVDLALPLCEDALNRGKAKLGPDSPYTIQCMNHLSLAYHLDGKMPWWCRSSRKR
jgi:eukaryotic-like serine/threonine-protein kinase